MWKKKAFQNRIIVAQLLHVNEALAWDKSQSSKTQVVEMTYLKGACSSVNTMVKVMKVYIEGMVCLVREKVWIVESSEDGEAQHPEMVWPSEENEYRDKNI